MVDVCQAVVVKAMEEVVACRASLSALSAALGSLGFRGSYRKDRPWLESSYEGRQLISKLEEVSNFGRQM